MKKKTILVADDSPIIRSVVKIYLRDYSIDFLEAETSERALEILESQSIDLLIADQKVPGLGGVGLLSTLRGHAKQRLKSVPVILLASDRSHESELRSLGVEPSAVLMKPVSGARIVDRVKEILGNGSSGSSERLITNGN